MIAPSHQAIAAERSGASKLSDRRRWVEGRERRLRGVQSSFPALDSAVYQAIAAERSGANKLSDRRR